MEPRINKLVDYLYWFLLIIYTNPGAILEALFNEDRGDGGINLVDFVFVLMFLCYVFVFYRKDVVIDRTYLKSLKYFIIFTLYIFLVFGFFVPAFKGTPNTDFITVFIKSRTTIFNLFLFVMTYKFFIRSHTIFLNIFLYSSILIMTLFIITVITGVDIIPIEKANRGFINIDRIFLIEYGLMPILIPMGVAMITFKYSFKRKNFVYIGFILMFIVWLLSLTRRHIFGSMVVLGLGLMYYNYFEHKALLPFSKIISIGFISILMVGFLNFTFPKYIEAGIAAVDQTIYVLTHGENTMGGQDQRFGFDRKFIVDIFKANPIFGTGFDNRWRTAAGGKAGYEASDYPFLAALAMAGISGIIAFLPVYVIMIKSLIRDVKLLRNRKIEYDSIEFFYLMTFILYFTFSIMQYMNWFRPISNQPHYEIHIYFAMYLASRKLFYKKNMNHLRIEGKR